MSSNLVHILFMSKYHQIILFSSDEEQTSTTNGGKRMEQTPGGQRNEPDGYFNIEMPTEELI